MRDTVREYFDGMAGRWDEVAVHPQDRVAVVIDTIGGLRGARVLDVGSGTGVLLETLLDRVGPGGIVLSLDLSRRMSEVARRKIQAPNLRFVVADFLDWVCDEVFDVVIAYSCLPHFGDPSAFFAAAGRCLGAHGLLLVAHIEGREAINGFHGGSAPTVSRDLPAVEELESLAMAQGFEGLRSRDDGDYYLLLSRKRGEA